MLFLELAKLQITCVKLCPKLGNWLIFIDATDYQLFADHLKPQNSLGLEKNVLRIKVRLINP